MESGSLLWIHGKRKYTITVVLIITHDSRIDSWRWEDYSQVRYPTSSCLIGLKFDKLRNHPAYRKHA
jgi:hypothetical protein